MPTTTAQSVLSANLAALGERHADLARRLLDTTPAADVEFVESGQGIPAGIQAGRPLCSRHRPLDEADRLVSTIDLVEHATVVVCGFGMGYHVRRLAEQFDGVGVVVVFEPDLPLLRAVLERVDHTSWLARGLVVWATDPADRGTLGAALDGAESIIAQGVVFLDHPASRSRLGESAAAFRQTFTDYVSTAKTVFTTTLMRSVDTIRNCLLNLDHYAGGSGITDLRDVCRGRPAVVVSAGPSLHRNLHLLAEPGVRDRCVIIAVQTMLKPLLELGVRPHFVTALDFHEISRRFYEGLDSDQLVDVTLIAEPKANPVIIDAFPGPVRCCASGFLDTLLGDAGAEMGTIKAGATVAHLAFYVGQWLGCDPIAVIGQDLAFSDGLYYAPGTAIDDVWAPELNPFNTIEMMQWQRIARHRLHLHRTVDVSGRTIYTDSQMRTYLQQFERDFAECEQLGVTVIDATEGGLAKQHTTAMPLAEVIDRYATDPLPTLPAATAEPDRRRVDLARGRLERIRRDIVDIVETADKAGRLLERMQEDQADAKRMSRHFERMDGHRRRIEERMVAFGLVNQLNQVGVFKRMKADRKLHLARDLAPVERQQAQLERDHVNVAWIRDAAAEMGDQLASALQLLAGRPVTTRRRAAVSVAAGTPRTPSRVAALVAVDPARNGLGVERSLATPFAGRPVIQATLERLGRSTLLESIILIVPDRAVDEVEALIDRDAIGRPVEIERCDGDSPFGPEQTAVAAARRWSDTCWRGGVAGMSVYDEVLCPTVMGPIMRRRELTAAVIVGPDWPLVDVSPESGCDAIVRRHLDHADVHHLVFTQAPPGLGGCLVDAALMKDLELRNRLCTVGALLVYQPHAPQHDAIAREANVQIDHRIRTSPRRFTFDTPRQRELLQRAVERRVETDPELGAVDIVQAVANESCHVALPQHVVLELTTERDGERDPSFPGSPAREPMPLDLATSILEPLGAAGDVALTLHGAGDPLLHESFDRVIAIGRRAGFAAVHVRTALPDDPIAFERLVESRPDVISVDVPVGAGDAGRRHDEVIASVGRLIERRSTCCGHPPAATIGLPWIVPRIRRSVATHESIDEFYDRWQHACGSVIIDPAPAGDGLAPVTTPRAALERERARTLTVLSDGTVLDGRGGIAGSLVTERVDEVWSRVTGARDDGR